MDQERNSYIEVSYSGNGESKENTSYRERHGITRGTGYTYRLLGTLNIAQFTWSKNNFWREDGCGVDVEQNEGRVERCTDST